MSFWDSISDYASSAASTAGSTLSSAFNKTEEVATGILAGAKQTVAAVTGAVSEKVGSVYDAAKSVVTSDPSPAAPADKPKVSPVVLLGVAGAALVLLMLATRKKGA